MKVLITGANGFIGRNLSAQLTVRKDFEVIPFTRDSTLDDFRAAIQSADFVCHLAGVNRPGDASEFAKVNTDLTKTLCAETEKAGRKIPFLFASSVHVERGNAYGASKLAAENVLLEYSKTTGAPVYIFRLPHVIGKWCRPNYNSVVATFCYNIARGLPIQIDDPSFRIRIVYIDDLVETFAAIMEGSLSCRQQCEVTPSYTITVGELADRLRSFRTSRETMITEPVGAGLARALYATYVSYLPMKDFSYAVAKHADPRGVFVEMLKTKESGQFSFFTAPAGVTRGGHYHHSKTEKFLVITGKARFRFREIGTGEVHQIDTDGENPCIVETIPGWAHDITNVGDREMVVMLWANEIFDPQHPDTYASPLE